MTPRSPLSRVSLWLSRCFDGFKMLTPVLPCGNTRVCPCPPWSPGPALCASAFPSPCSPPEHRTSAWPGPGTPFPGMLPGDAGYLGGRKRGCCVVEMHRNEEEHSGRSLSPWARCPDQVRDGKISAGWGMGGLAQHGAPVMQGRWQTLI